MAFKKLRISDPIVTEDELMSSGNYIKKKKSVSTRYSEYLKIRILISVIQSLLKI